MATRWSERDLATFQQNSGRGMAPEAQGEVNHSKIAVRTGDATKYRNVVAFRGNERFDSKLELKRYEELLELWRLKQIEFFLRQVSFKLPGGVRYRVDFMVFYPMGTANSDVNVLIGTPFLVGFEDCKGYRNQASMNKIKQVEDIYGIKVRLIERAKKGRK